MRVISHPSTNQRGKNKKQKMDQTAEQIVILPSQSFDSLPCLFLSDRFFSTPRRRSRAFFPLSPLSLSLSVLRLVSLSVCVSPYSLFRCSHALYSFRFALFFLSTRFSLICFYYSGFWSYPPSVELFSFNLAASSRLLF